MLVGRGGIADGIGVVADMNGTVESVELMITGGPPTDWVKWKLEGLTIVNGGTGCGIEMELVTVGCAVAEELPKRDEVMEAACVNDDPESDVSIDDG